VKRVLSKRTARSARSLIAAVGLLLTVGAPVGVPGIGHAAAPAPYRFVGRPIALYQFVPPITPGNGAYFYRVIVRLNRPLPRSGRHLLASATVDGGGGYEGVVPAVPLRRRHPHRYCYEQVLESDAQPHDIPALDHPKPGRPAVIAMYLPPTAATPTLRATVPLHRDRDPNPDSTAYLYERRLGCVRG